MEHDFSDYRSSHLGKGQDYDIDLDKGDFNSYMARHEADIVRKVVNSLYPDGVANYLDFACGTGRITQLVETFSQRSVGVDVSETMLSQARTKCKTTEFLVQDITRDPLVPQSFDLVTAFRFFGNAQDGLRLDALQAIATLLKPGGNLIVNNHRNPKSIHSRLLRLRGSEVPGTFDPTEFKKLLKKCGFQIRYVRGIGAWLVMYKLFSERVLSSKLAPIIECTSRIPGIWSYCPDAVIVARRV